MDGEPVYPDLQSLPEKVDGCLIVVPPVETERVVREADAAGIHNIWMQQGADSPEAIEYCRQHGMNEVHGECILMFAAPVKSYHKVHRFFRGVFGKLPN